MLNGCWNVFFVHAIYLRDNASSYAIFVLMNRVDRFMIGRYLYGRCLQDNVLLELSTKGGTVQDTEDIIICVGPTQVGTYLKFVVSSCSVGTSALSGQRLIGQYLGLKPT